MFMSLAGIVIAQQYERVERSADFIAGKNRSNTINDALIANGNVRTSCTQFNLAPLALESETACQRARSALIDRLKTAHLSIEIPPMTAPAPNNAVDDFIHQSDVSSAIFNALFVEYVDSGLQLTDDPIIYTLARTNMIHLPKLAELISAVKGLEPLIVDGFVTDSLAAGFVGQVNLLKRQTFRTLQALNAANPGDESKRLLEDLTLLKQTFDQYWKLVENRKFQYFTQPQTERFLERVAANANKIEAIQNQIHTHVERQLTASLTAMYNSALSLFIATLALCVLIQVVIVLVFKWLIFAVNALQVAERKSTQSAVTLERALEKQDKMFAIIGHELRTPAASLKMQIDELLHKNSVDKPILGLSKTAEHLLDVLDDMRIGTNAALAKQNHTASRFSVFDLVEESINNVKYIASQYQVELSLKGTKATATGHYGFKKPLRQIIINLTKNAIIHSKGTSVELVLEHAPLNDTETAFTLQIKDNGVGIKPDSVERLFGAFERGDSQSEGTGLGLNVSRELARTLKQGDLRHTPNPTGGSIFVFTFTLEKAHANQEETSPASSHLKGLKVLLVEDTPTLRMLGKTMLNRAGAVVTDAENGAEGLKLASDNVYDLIVTDIMMPEVDGYALTTQLRSMGILTPIIGVTGATVGNEAERLMNCGANAVLGKPLNINALEWQLTQLSPKT